MPFPKQWGYGAGGGAAGRIESQIPQIPTYAGLAQQYLGGIAAGAPPSMHQWIPEAVQRNMATVSAGGTTDPVHSQKMGQIRGQVRGILGGGASQAARMGAAGTARPGVRRQAAEAFGTGAALAESERAKRIQSGAESAMRTGAGLYGYPAGEHQASQTAYGQLMGQMLAGPMGPTWTNMGSFYRNRPGGGGGMLGGMMGRR